jgi:hypothetical protein
MRNYPEPLTVDGKIRDGVNGVYRVERVEQGSFDGGLGLAWATRVQPSGHTPPR